MATLLPLSGPLGHRRAAHLLRRVSFRYTKLRIDQLAALTAGEALDQLLVIPDPQMVQPVYDNPGTPGVEHTTWLLPTNLPLPDGQVVLRRYVAGWWLHEALFDPGISHRMALFFHQHLMVGILAFGNQHYFDYLRLLHWGALGNFKKLTTKIITDNAMLLYLNNHENLKSNPNENFAREFFELFTVGKGPQLGPGDYTNYTEDDISTAARVFTGFRARSQRDQYDPETGIPRGRVVVSEHDTKDKVFSDKFQGTSIAGAKTADDMWLEVNAFVDMVFAQEATARTFCRRLYRWFVRKNISQEVEADIIGPLVQVFRDNQFEVQPVLRLLLESRHFYDADDADPADETIGCLVKSPLDLALQTLSFFEVPTTSPAADPRQLYFLEMALGIGDWMLLDAGFPLFDPADVAGYPAYYQVPFYNRAWFLSNTIVPRYKFAAKLLSGKVSYGDFPDAPIYLRLDIVAWVKTGAICSDPADAEALVRALLHYLLPEQPDEARFEYFYRDTFLNQLPPADWAYEWNHFLETGDDTEVRIPLERLVTAILYAPEYQLF